MAARFTEASRHLLTVFGLAQIPPAHVVVKRNPEIIQEQQMVIPVFLHPVQQRFLLLFGIPVLCLFIFGPPCRDQPVIPFFIFPDDNPITVRVFGQSPQHDY